MLRWRLVEEGRESEAFAIITWQKQLFDFAVRCKRAASAHDAKISWRRVPK